jgi:hypothetical protein
MGCMSWDDPVLELPTSFNGNSYSIYTKAFYNLTEVEKVVISGKVSSIGNMAFSAGVTEIDIDEATALTNIESGALAGTSITYIYIPAAVTYIGMGAFPNTIEHVELADTANWQLDLDDYYGVAVELIDTTAEAAAYFKANGEYGFVKAMG